MNVKELKTHLHDLPDGMLVILSSDEEGNHYREAHVAEVYAYEQDGHEFTLVEDEDTEEMYGPYSLVIWP